MNNKAELAPNRVSSILSTFPFFFPSSSLLSAHDDGAEPIVSQPGACCFSIRWVPQLSPPGGKRH